MSQSVNVFAILDFDFNCEFHALMACAPRGQDMLVLRSARFSGRLAELSEKRDEAGSPPGYNRLVILRELPGLLVLQSFLIPPGEVPVLKNYDWISTKSNAPSIARPGGVVIVSGIPRLCRTSRQPTIASRISPNACNFVFPSLTQPGIEGHSATHIPSSSCSKVTFNFKDFQLMPQDFVKLGYQAF